MAYGNDGSLIGAVLTIFLVVALVFGARACEIAECNSICTANKSGARWTWTQGCYCKDADGLYNPKDSRER